MHLIIVQLQVCIVLEGRSEGGLSVATGPRILEGCGKTRDPIESLYE